ncbi:MAG: GGDEF domain-containing protein [Methylophilus sp.]
MNNEIVDLGYKMHRHDNNFTNDVLKLLNLCSSWILIRQQWLIDNMRSILTGENAPSFNDMVDFDNGTLINLKLPNNLVHTFNLTKSILELSWQKVIKASHPLTELTLVEQLNEYQLVAHQFMLDAKEASQLLWYEFTTRDTLTGAWTRLTLSACLKDELARSQRYKIPSSIVLLDQNNFKSINDSYGHLVGDKVLAMTAEVIQQNLRPNDKLFRYGGDEWLIVMPNTNRLQAQITVERIQNIYVTHTFNSNLGESFFSSFSFGIAESNDYDRIEHWIDDADYQLYAKKLKHKYSSNPDVTESQ